MARDFSLAGLLRLRQLQQDAAAGVASAANGRLRDTQAQRARMRADLGTHSVDPVDTFSLVAVAAARASARGMLAELQVVAEEQLAAVDTATRELSAARARALQLEKLADKHGELQHADDLRGEQAVLDELASTAWHRTREDDA